MHDFLDSAVSRLHAKEDGVLYRGMALRPEHDFVPGKEFTDPGYMSTSINKQYATEFAKMRAGQKSMIPQQGAKVYSGTKPVVMRIHVKKGDHMMPGDHTVREVILPRGIRHKVTSIDPDGTINVERVRDE